ncbi:MAG: AI-2E family transporter [Candidatus Delongbacteria bacterium]|nr:AI-2E family transporter [Candidatus Delongbacteria bacterium]MBN2834605.1 AI-2E family transporter [Candidatus Delongbacteria bacterium]
MNEKSITLQGIFYGIILFIITLSFFKIIEPFLIDVFLSVVLLIMFKRPYSFFLKKFNKNPRTASMMTIILIIFTVLIPVSIIGVMVSVEAGENYKIISDKWQNVDVALEVENIKNSLSEISFLKERISDFDVSTISAKLGESASKLIEIVFSIIKGVFVNLSFIVIHFFLILFILYYLFIDGKDFINKIHHLIPLKDKDERAIASEISKITEAIIFNTFLIGFIEGAYGGLILFLTGTGSPFFWGLIMTFLSMIPLVGANTILLPAAIIQIASGHYIKGIIIIIFGCGAVLVNQNLIKPKLDGKRSGLHPAIVFLASMGGLAWLGLPGFIAGPIIAAVFIVIWHQFGVNYKTQLTKFNRG